jgi:hypothetical protein
VKIAKDKNTTENEVIQIIIINTNVHFWHDQLIKNGEKSMGLLNTKDCLQSSTNVKNFIEKEGRLPNYVTISGDKYSIVDYMYISSNFISDMCLYGKANASVFMKMGVDTPKIIPIKANIDKATFCDMNKRVADYFNNKERAPSYVSSKYGNVQFQAHIYANAKILDFYKKNKALPNHVSLNLDKNSKILTYLPKMPPEEVKLNYSTTWSHSKKIKGETVMMWSIISNFGSRERDWESPKYVAPKRAVINEVNKVTVTISGYETMTFKKPVKGWKFSGIMGDSLYQTYSVKGNPDNKSFTMKCYDKNGKIIKQHKSKVEYIPWHQQL